MKLEKKSGDNSAVFNPSEDANNAQNQQFNKSPKGEEHQGRESIIDRIEKQSTQQARGDHENGKRSDQASQNNDQDAANALQVQTKSPDGKFAQRPTAGFGAHNEGNEEGPFLLAKEDDFDDDPTHNNIRIVRNVSEMPSERAFSPDQESQPHVKMFPIIEEKYNRQGMIEEVDEKAIIHYEA